MDDNIIIRNEVPSDYITVEKLTFEAFETVELPNRELTNEHFFAHLIRNDKSFVPKLDFVAELDGEIIGNIMYNLVPIYQPDNKVIQVLSLALLSVSPYFQKQGVGSQLIHYSLKVAELLGYKGVIVLGYPEYYSKFGFLPACNFGLKWLDGTELDAFQALELEKGYLGNEGGTWELAESFAMLTNEAKFRSYHQKFTL